jgi:hypothetical protein
VDRNGRLLRNKDEDIISTSMETWSSSIKNAKSGNVLLGRNRLNLHKVDLVSRLKMPLVTEM